LRALANRSGLYGPEPPERADRSRHPGIFEAVRADGIDVHLDERGQPRIVERDFVVEPELDGLRLDQFLKHKIPRLSRTRIQAIIRESVSFADGRPARPNRRVAAGDRLVLRREAQPEPPCPRRFDVLHRDDEVMVIDKPAGLPVHISARYYFNTLTRVVSERFPGEGWQICHRLDRETSGVMVLARGRAAAAALKGAFERKQTRKRYLAVVHGRPAERFAIDLPLGLTADPNALISIRMVVRDDAAPARTEVRTISTTGSLSLLECRPITGRQHQIRAHLAAVGHPIVGDKLYGHGDEVFAAACDDRLDPETRAALILPRHALHAASIEIPHPSSGEMLSVESPLPADMAALVNR
jgi:23S rRNA pseudouridine1911/1915/1917 synthase